MDGIFQVTVAAEGCDYAALIMIVIFNQCRKVLFQQHKWYQSDCARDESDGDDSGHRASAGSSAEKRGANFGRSTLDDRTFCR